MRRSILIVMDGCGAGEAPDATEFGDFDHPATILHVLDRFPHLNLPNLRDSGFLSACKVSSPRTDILDRMGFGCRFGRLQELSQGGKDSVTGHWEMAGIKTMERFPTYPDGFPPEVIDRFEAKIHRKTIGNMAASGTEIITRLGREHLRTGFPILYTSADSVFQIACHEEVVLLDQLYDFCATARNLLVEPDNVQRVIARPFTGSETAGFTRTENRRDFPLPAPPNLCDVLGDVFGIGVVPELFAERGFRQVRRTQSNKEHAEMMESAMGSDARFIWANFEDFDMKFGHRNDVAGFAGCLEDFDRYLGSLIPKLGEDDLLILTADHGNDPTSTSTDHSREFVPFVALGQNIQSLNLGDRRGMDSVGASVAAHLAIPWAQGTSLIN